jgi:predicted transposase YdaD
VSFPFLVLDRRAEFQYIDLLMETDSFFFQLLKQLPETLFALLGEPLTRVADYRFDALEVKKSYRLDGLFVPARVDLPVYFVEVQFRRVRRFYANLFAKVFSNGPMSS